MQECARPGLVTFIGLALVLGGLVACASVQVPDAGYDIHAVSDPSVIERGRYLVYGPGHCASCHGDPAREDETRLGRQVPLSGGRRFQLGPVGTIVTPNITNDMSTGIGALSDDMLVRSLRYSVSRQGRTLAPFMAFADLADEDLQAVISFLRAAPTVKNPTPASDLSWLGMLGINFLMDPQSPAVPPPRRLTPARTAEYGDYLANTVANCRGCHTLRSKLTGAFIGPDFAGGAPMDEAGTAYTPPNLTPVPGGIVDTLAEEDFIDRFRSRSRDQSGSPMPWAAFAQMTDTDLGAIYRYLRSLHAAER
jgi:mono/diheme cytochrome c family protein